MIRKSLFCLEMLVISIFMYCYAYATTITIDFTFDKHDNVVDHLKLYYNDTLLMTSDDCELTDNSPDYTLVCVTTFEVDDIIGSNFLTRVKRFYLTAYLISPEAENFETPFSNVGKVVPNIVKNKILLF